jgi:S-formylglutathione hydrolase FrmB
MSLIIYILIGILAASATFANAFVADASLFAISSSSNNNIFKTKQSSVSSLKSTLDSSTDESKSAPSQTQTQTTPITILSKTKVGGVDGGYYHRIKHVSSSTKTDMIFGLFLPHAYTDVSGKNDSSSSPARSTPTPVMFWLSGLTCDDTNFAQKAGGNAFHAANRENIALVIPDTSPRGKKDHDGNDIPDDVDSYDLGIGAGFYIDATESPYDVNYNMRTYIKTELPNLLQEHFNLGTKSISGHSMG